MNKTLYLVRGIPGSGKSTFAKHLDGFLREADMYFINREDGSYNFDPSKIKDAHNWCRQEVESIMKEEENVIVSNTFTQEWEMDAYYQLAKQYGYQVFSVIVENRHEGVNQHGVPQDKLEIMRNRFEIKL